MEMLAVQWSLTVVGLGLALFATSLWLFAEHLQVAKRR